MVDGKIFRGLIGGGGVDDYWTLKSNESELHCSYLHKTLINHLGLLCTCNRSLANEMREEDKSEGGLLAFFRSGFFPERDLWYVQGCCTSQLK